MVFKWNQDVKRCAFLIGLMFPNLFFADLVYVANLGDDTVSVIDTYINSVVATVGVGDEPIGIAITPDGNFAYVTNQGDSINPSTVSVIDTTTNMVVATVPVDVFPQQIAITPDGLKAYVANQQSNSVTVIDTTTNMPMTTIMLGGGNSPRGVAITPDGSYVYVTLVSPTVLIIDTSTDMVVPPSIGIAGGTLPVGIAITPNGLFAYVANSGVTSVAVIDLTMNMQVPPVIPAGLNCAQVAITPDGSFVYVSATSGADVTVIDTNTNMIVATISLSGFGNGIAITPDGEYAYVASGPNGVERIDISTNSVIGAPIPVGNSPKGVAIVARSASSSPRNLTGDQINNDFGLIYELVNELRWEPPLLENVAGYFVYRNGVKIATLNASTLEYADHNRAQGVPTLYSVTSFNTNGSESAPISIEIL